MPDLESFIISSKNQDNLKSGIVRKKKKKENRAKEENKLVVEGLDSVSFEIKSSIAEKANELEIRIFF